MLRLRVGHLLGKTLDELGPMPKWEMLAWANYMVKHQPRPQGML